MQISAQDGGYLGLISVGRQAQRFNMEELPVIESVPEDEEEEEKRASSESLPLESDPIQASS
jgi:hypothetical protein